VINKIHKTFHLLPYVSLKQRKGEHEAREHLVCFQTVPACNWRRLTAPPVSRSAYRCAMLMRDKNENATKRRWVCRLRKTASMDTCKLRKVSAYIGLNSHQMINSHQMRPSFCVKIIFYYVYKKNSLRDQQIIVHCSLLLRAGGLQ